MSWNYTVHQINRSFEQIAHWYQDFLRRSEASFRALHERILYLEQQQASQGPSDEQVERVLRKILAERFADPQSQNEHPGSTKDVNYFVKPPDNGASIPRAPSIDPMVLQVDPEAVPSKAYGQTFQMLEKGLSEYPQVDVTRSAVKDTNPRSEETFKQPDTPNRYGRPW